MNIFNHTEKPDNEQKIYSVHSTVFHGNVNTLVELLNKLEAILVDVRFTIPPQPIKWSKQYLKLLLKKRYLHVPVLGSRLSENKISDLGKVDPSNTKHRLQNPLLGIKIINEVRVNIVLFCSCQVSATCHLKNIKDEINKHGKVVEIIDELKNLGIN